MGNRWKIFLLSLAVFSLVLVVVRCFREKTSEDLSSDVVQDVRLEDYPRLLDSCRVAFGIVAPKASNVQVDVAGTKYEMQKTENGVWTVVTPSLEPGFHYYSFLVDGMSFSDPLGQSYYGYGRWSSGIEIPEDGMDDFDVQDVPHGEVRMVQYYSDVDDCWRQLMVYTPAGYDECEADYPVLYVLHGSGENHSAWMVQGRTPQIMDNLIASGEAVPKVVVSVDSNVCSLVGGVEPINGWRSVENFRIELLDNVIPFVEHRYRVRRENRWRAVCGSSMGGLQSFFIGLRQPEVFTSVGVFSTGMFSEIGGVVLLDLETEVPGMLSASADFNNKFDVFFMTCGEQDTVVNSMRNIVKTMSDAGVEVKFNTYPGGHEWQVWRKSLHEFVQYIFK